MLFIHALSLCTRILLSCRQPKSNTLSTLLQTKGYSDSPSVISAHLFSLSLHLSPSLFFSLFFFSRELILPELISHEPSLIAWLQSPHAAAMVTGRACSCSERKFNTTFDDISRMRCTRMCPCMCGCLLVQVRLIYLTDLYPSQKATGVRKSCDSVLCVSHFLITSENEKYQQIVWSYMSICKHSLLRGLRFVSELWFLWVLSVSTLL